MSCDNMGVVFILISVLLLPYMVYFIYLYYGVKIETEKMKEKREKR